MQLKAQRLRTKASKARIKASMQDSTNRSPQRIGKQGLRLRLLRLQAKALKEGLKAEAKATRDDLKAARSTGAVFVESKLKKRTPCALMSADPSPWLLEVS